MADGAFVVAPGGWRNRASPAPITRVAVTAALTTATRVVFRPCTNSR